MSLIEIPGGNRGHGVGAVLEKVMTKNVSGEHAKKSVFRFRNPNES